MNEQLLSQLQARANNRGLVLAEEKSIVQELGTTHEGLATELERLERSGQAEILAPLPYLVLRLRKWPSKRENAADSHVSAYSYPKLLQTKPLINSYRQPSSGPLMQEILETLGETDAASFKKATELYSPNVIRETLDRVRRARGIRKSRTALFRHLLPRIARGSHQSN